jgi:Metallo-peptidase family M12
MRRPDYLRTLAFILLIIALACFVVSITLLAHQRAWVDAAAYLLPIAVVLAAIGLCILRVKNRIHPCIKKHHVTTIDIPTVLRSINEGVPFSITLGKEALDLLVHQEPLGDENGEIIEITNEGEILRRRGSADITYVGRVVDAEEKNEVRFTITSNTLTGYVLHGSDWWFVEPLRLFRIDADPSEYLVYRTSDLRFELKLEDDTVPIKVEQFDSGSLPDGSGYLSSSPSSTSTSSGHVVGPSIGIALVADKEYSQAAAWTGSLWYQHQSSVLHNVNGLYKANLGCWFTPKVWILNYPGLTDCNASTLLDDLEKVVENAWGDLRLLQTRKTMGTEVAHLTSGKNLDGNTLGIAWQPGVYSLSQHQLIWIGGGGGFGGPPNLAFQNMMIMAHELGHNLNAAHGEADEWCVSHFIWCWDYERSLMWPTFYDDNNAWISDGSKNASHNNRKRINTNLAGQRNRNY